MSVSPTRCPLAASPAAVTMMSRGDHVASLASATPTLAGHMKPPSTPALRVALLALCVVASGASLLPSAATVIAAPQPAPVRPHLAFDGSAGPPPPGIVRGAPARPLAVAKIPLSRRAAAGAAAGGLATSPPDPEILGFAQYGEVLSGAWVADLRFDLLSTIAYFGVNVNSNGTLVTGDTGYTTWWSGQETTLINAAHTAGDRVVLTVKAFSDSVIAGVTGTELARQTLINGIITEVVTRPADGVNIDFEGVSSSLSGNFTTFVAELRAALNARAGAHSYLTVDTYASAGQGGTMYDLASLWHYVDGLDLMGYGFAPCVAGHAGPTAPMGGCWYNVTQAVSDYMTKYGVPASELLLGVPYYGYKWSVTGVTGAGQDAVVPGSTDSADTYAGALSDFRCALRLQQHWDPTFQEPWASWYSPSVGDPCAGNHGSYRELYYDNAQSLGIKYDLVNTRKLRGIAIWSLGYDSGTNDLWNEISAKFTVAKYPTFRPNAVGAPDVAISPDGAQLIFWQGAGRHLVEAWWNGTWNGPVDWTATNGWPSSMSSAPSVAIAPDGTQLVFWEGVGGHLMEAWWHGAWNGPVDWTVARGWSPTVTSAPSVALRPDGTQVIFWQGQGGHLVEAWWNGSWNGPVDWTAANRWEAPLTGSPGVAFTAGGTQLVFWQGPGGRLTEAWWNGSWNGPVDVTAANRWSASLTSAPSVALAPDGTQLVYWQAAGGHLLEAWWNGSWNGPVDWTAANGWAPSLTSAPSVSTAGDGTQLVFWQGTGAHLMEAWWHGGWSGVVDWTAAGG
jgi:spore germination protein YaaH